MKRYKMSDVNIIGIMYFTKSLVLFLLSLDVYLGVTDGANADVEKHLEQGKKLLAAGQLAEALQHYHAAVDGDPSNYLTYFRRATVFLALGKSKSALPDLSKVIELKPDFTSARVQRGNVLLKQGKLDEAEADYRKVLESDPSHSDAGSKLLSLDKLRENIDEAYQMFEHRQYPSVVKILEEPVETCPWDPNLRELRAEAYIEIGDYSSAINDIRPTTSLISDNRKAHLKMSMLHYAMGDADSSLVQIRECLKLDPDDKQCFPHYKKVKKLVKQIDAAQSAKDEQRYDDCLSKANQILKIEPDQDAFQLRGKSFLCHCNAKNGNTQAAFDTCNDLLSRDPNDIHAMMDRGDTYISNEQWDEAIKDFQKVLDIDENNNRAKEGIKKAQKLLKQSQKRDYYKILGVKRNAKKKDILKAYRKLAAKWHPDKHEGGDKERAEKKFIDIAAAKEVLTDPEKREKFDNGEDPLDPEAQQGGGGGPFWHQGFNPFGNGGFQFKFHFN